MAMNDEVVSFLSSWQQLSAENKATGLVAFSKPDLASGQKPATPQLAAGVRSTSVNVSSTTTFPGVHLYSYYSYLYYYPTMHWNLDKTPETDDYWVGIYKKGASNDQYITYQWLYKTAQGSYYIGKLNTTAGIESTERTDEFELRLFKADYQRVDAETNVLRGMILAAPTNPDEHTSNYFAVRAKPLQSEMRDFVQAIQNAESHARGTSAQMLSLHDLQQQWDKFSHHQQQLLYPVLEQSMLPDQIRKPGPKALDRPEPKVAFPDLANNLRLSADDSNIADIPQKVVLTITINKSYTYIYPVVNVTEAVPTKWAWMGVYRTQSNVSFNPDNYIDNDWQYVGTGEEKTTYLNNIQEYAEGPVENQYVGAIFDWQGGAYVQIGLASNTILASISATPAIPPPDFQPDFDRDTALRYAKLSQLAYQPYSVVEQELPTYGLQAEMQIYDASTDTNGFIATDDSSTVVVFRGTDIKSWRNIFTDMWFFRKRIMPEPPDYGHGGFITAFNSVYSSIKNKIEPSLGKKKLFVAGHSLGGALASLLTYCISFEYSEAQPVMYVYGCPPVGDSNFANYFDGMDSNTITIQNDPVSTGQLILLGPWVGLYKPIMVKYLPEAAGHSITDYIKQIENL